MDVGSVGGTVVRVRAAGWTIMIWRDPESLPGSDKRKSENRLLQRLNDVLISPQHSIHDRLSIYLLSPCISLYEIRNVFIKIDRQIQSYICPIEFPAFPTAEIILFLHLITLNDIDGLLFSQPGALI
jgi:hypothetical protein